METTYCGVVQGLLWGCIPFFTADQHSVLRRRLICRSITDTTTYPTAAAGLAEGLRI